MEILIIIGVLVLVGNLMTPVKSEVALKKPVNKCPPHNWAYPPDNTPMICMKCNFRSGSG